MQSRQWDILQEEALGRLRSRDVKGGVGGRHHPPSGPPRSVAPRRGGGCRCRLGPFSEGSEEPGKRARAAPGARRGARSVPADANARALPRPSPASVSPRFPQAGAGGAAHGGTASARDPRGGAHGARGPPAGAAPRGQRHLMLFPAGGRRAEKSETPPPPPPPPAPGPKYKETSEGGRRERGRGAEERRRRASARVPPQPRVPHGPEAAPPGPPGAPPLSRPEPPPQGAALLPNLAMRGGRRRARSPAPRRLPLRASVSPSVKMRRVL
ncbi:collagen alpha-1(III) chain-like [Trichosurus vulpecula]|uniref:collagen alpha-1(III) chain-like n=1 Tax=Trichosurus vulpecula TaxID=9337 RepID=UPI00186B38B9|nr:collagen alpha-1(III) chain-like [Trichosurus vulpecula]